LWPCSRASARSALALTTVDYRTVDRDAQRIPDNATGAFYDDFNGRSAEFTPVVPDGKSTGTSTNFTAASIAATDHGAEGGRGLQSVERGVPAVITERSK
jgi:Mce-associated membrane protein